MCKYSQSDSAKADVAVGVTSGQMGIGCSPQAVQMDACTQVLLWATCVQDVLFALECGTQVLDVYQLEHVKPAVRDAVVWHLLSRTGNDMRTFRQSVLPHISLTVYSQLVKSAQHSLTGAKSHAYVNV